MDSAAGGRRRARPAELWSSLDAGQRRTLVLMGLAVAALHALGFLTLIALIGGHPQRTGAAGAFTIGIGVTAYTLGLRHAFDADHIAAIDNTTRKLMGEGRRPLSVGFWFSLGHSSVVFALALLVSLGVRSVGGAVADGHSALHQAAGWIGTLVSGSFLYAIAALNIAILWGIIRVLRELRAGRYDERRLEEHLQRRGLMNRLLGRLTRTVSSPARMYPVGVLFGLGFDTATEVALLILAAGAAGAGLPWYAFLCLPLLFAAGMSLMDSLDGSVMNLAYGWAFARPVRRVFYNLVVTGLSVAVALIVGTIEIGGLASSELGLTGSFWSWLRGIDFNALGFVIVALFVVTWAVAVAVWRVGRLEARWRAGVDDHSTR
ncbi:MAG TPA: HoxN/HupN/NixA family nickel/cobalt transporter [Solirubrobacteraceae bacterium]|nr:HoxN/HupN/NixA family nickel/cobalt transporter [Solirubrobacteraceae bacterium]